MLCALVAAYKRQGENEEDDEAKVMRRFFCHWNQKLRPAPSG